MVNRKEMDYKYLVKNLKHTRIYFTTTVEKRGYIYNVFTEKINGLVLLHIVSYVKEMKYIKGVTEVVYNTISICTGYDTLSHDLMISEIDRLIDKLYDFKQKK